MDFLLGGLNTNFIIYIIYDEVNINHSPIK